MNPRIALFILFSTSFSAAFSQPVITAANVGPRDGDRISYYYGEGVLSQGFAGPAQTWDFSAVNTLTTFVGYMGQCLTSVNCQHFPGSNLVNITPQVEYFMGTTDDSMCIKGTYYYKSNNKTELYSDPHRMLQFPFTYGDKYVDSFRSFQASVTATLTHYGNDSTEADAWGTITTKAGTFSNVLRLKKVLNYQDDYDTANAQPWFSLHTRIVTYLWFLPGHHEFIYMVTTKYTDDPRQAPMTLQTGYSTIGAPADVPELNANRTLVENPAKGTVRFRLINEAGSTASYTIRDLQGRTVANGSRQINFGDCIVRIPVDGWAPGLYFLSVANSGKSSSHRLIIE